MGKVVDFGEYKKQKDEAYRLKMLSEGKIEEYTCNSCGETFEVYDDNFPQKCPHCGVEFIW